jgi:hypothetical protein
MVLGMKIALCLSGQPRGLPLSLKMLKANIVGIENMDVFMHAWFDPTTIGQSYDSAQANQQNIVGVVHPQTTELLLSLHPKDYIFEPQKEFPFARRFMSPPEANQERMASIFYSIYTANMLKKRYEFLNGFEYDLVIRARYDLWYEQPINVMDYLEQSRTHIVTAEKFQGIRNNPSFEHGPYTMTDIFAFSSSKNMDVFCDTFPHMSFIHSQINPPYGENYLGFRVRVMNGLNAFCAPFNYEIMHRVVNINNIDELEKMYV